MDAEITFGNAPKRMQQTMDVARDTPAHAVVSKGRDIDLLLILLEDWLVWCRSTGKEAHAADLIERTRAELRNQ